MSAPQRLTGEPTAETVLAALDAASGGKIADTRLIAPEVSTTAADQQTDPAKRSEANEAIFKERARWQLALSDVLKSLVSREMVVMEKL